MLADYTTDSKTHDITSLKTRWIDRNRLKASNHFGAMPDDPDASGYCTIGNTVDEFLRTQNEKKVLGSESDSLQKKVLKIVSILNRVKYEGIDELTKYMHPKKGIVMTWNVLFGGKEDLTFMRSDIKNIENHHFKKIHWGYTYGKGDKVRMSLYDYISKLTKSFNSISKMKKLKTLKGFHCPFGTECRGYEVFWINESSETKEYDWHGLLIIFEKYHEKWYVVGLLRDRWTI